MSDASILNAKKTYIETGRLNRNLINKEVAISWYKCKLQNMLPNDPIKIQGNKINSHFSVKFMAYLDSIISEKYQYILVNTSLQKCSSRIVDTKISMMDSIDDLAIGTNAGYIAFKTQLLQTVTPDEHYLECMTSYYSTGLLITNNDKLQGVLLLLSDTKPNEYDLLKIREYLTKYNKREDVEVINESISENDDLKIELSTIFAYPEDYFRHFNKSIEKLEHSALPILIRGDSGSGKSTLSLYFALKKSQNPVIVNLLDTIPIIHKAFIEKALYQNETLVIENIQEISQDAISLLTVYNDELTSYISSDKPFKYKCLNLILSIDYNRFENIKDTTKGKQIDKLVNKLKINTVNLVNTNAFESDYTLLVDAILERNSLKAKDAVYSKLKYFCGNKTFKQIQESIEKSVLSGSIDANRMLTNLEFDHDDKIDSLEVFEKKYILKIYELLEENMSATADALKIGRSTLYRKLEKYQNDTL